ncbi:hypothetical protein FHS21_002817 [Phyllobacterium trifolii]|uniref:Uncharacterized protein n=1 Tax=Phyllobacterium trifolii TaxID=300193 RepID=A0A839UBV6_9HYPH|nr:hypothetical protein [Phyllobacterium trifolii]
MIATPPFDVGMVGRQDVPTASPKTGEATLSVSIRFLVLFMPEALPAWI